MMFPILLVTAVVVGLAVATVAAFRSQISRALVVRRFRRQLTKLEIVTAFWRACLPD